MMLQRSAAPSMQRLPAQQCTQGQRCTAFVAPTRRTPQVACSASKQEEPTPLGRNLALGAMALASATCLSLQAPLDAGAVFSKSGGNVTPKNYADLSNQDLRGGDFTKAEARGANFSNSNLQAMSFYGIIAPGANFSGVNAKLTNFDSAELENTDFTDAVLEEAFFSNTVLKGIKITGSDWTEVNLRTDQRKFLCSIADGVNSKTGLETRESLLCP